MPLIAAAPFATSLARPLERRRLLVLGVSLSLHAALLFAIGLLARPVLQDRPSPAFEMIFGAQPPPLASAAPPALAASSPAPPSAAAAPLPTAPAAPPTPDPAGAPPPETASRAVAAGAALAPPVASLAPALPSDATPAVAPLVEPPPAPAAGPKTALHPTQTRPAPRAPASERASRRPAVSAPRAADPPAPSSLAEPASMPSPPPIMMAPVRAPAAATISSEWTATLASWIRSRTRYPEAARRLGQQGVVTVRFTVGRDGEVLEAHVAQPSGSESLDQAALDMFRAARVPAFPSEMQGAQVTISVPVRYRLES